MTGPASASRERLLALSQSAPGTDMGKVLRQFWQPVAVSEDIVAGAAQPLRIMGEDLTLYRGASGQPYLVGGHCPHRLTLLHSGWVQGEEIRCIYHGWKFDGTGRCTERPAEGEAGLQGVRIAGYPLHEYCGLIFAYMGALPAPAFDLPRKSVFERPGGLVFARQQAWPCNWFQQVENSLDAVHVSFVHQAGKVGPFGAAVTAAIPELAYEETESGIRQTATRSKSNVRISDWTFPNNNHIVIPGFSKDDPWIDVGVWMVPNDDTTTTRFQLYAIPGDDKAAVARLLERFAAYGHYNPAEHHDALFLRREYPEETVFQLTSAQDYVATVGQGAIMDRPNEHLGKSDLGIAFLRRIFWREMEAVRDGRAAKQWRASGHAAELPRQLEATGA